jgi:hypothetical protein
VTRGALVQLNFPFRTRWLEHNLSFQAGSSITSHSRHAESGTVAIERFGLKEALKRRARTVLRLQFGS